MPYRQAGNTSCLDENLFALLKQICGSSSSWTKQDISPPPQAVTEPEWTFLPNPCLTFCCSTHHLRQKQQDTPGSVDPNHRTPNFMWEINLSVSSDPPIWTKQGLPRTIPSSVEPVLILGGHLGCRGPPGREVAWWTETHSVSGTHLDEEVWNIQFKSKVWKRFLACWGKSHSSISGKKAGDRDTAVRQTLDRSVQSEDVNTELEEQHLLWTQKGHEDNLLHSSSTSLATEKATKLTASISFKQKWPLQFAASQESFSTDTSPSILALEQQSYPIQNPKLSDLVTPLTSPGSNPYQQL